MRKPARKAASEPPRGQARSPRDEAAGSAPDSVGQRLRRERERQGIGVRELARRVDVSASLISQIELGRATPSVGTLYAIVNELNISLDELFFEASDVAASGGQPEIGVVPLPPQGKAVLAAVDGQDDPSHPAIAPVQIARGAAPGGPLVRGGDRQMIQLEAGVTWERLTAATEHGVDFLYVTYDVGSASAPENSLIRHAGREYGFVIEGRLGVTVGFDTYELLPGDSISFASTTPHRLFNPGDTPAKAIWFTLGREDALIGRRLDSGEPQ